MRWLSIPIEQVHTLQNTVLVFLFLVLSIFPPECKIQDILHDVYIQPKGTQKNFS